MANTKNTPSRTSRRSDRYGDSNNNKKKKNILKRHEQSNRNIKPIKHEHSKNAKTANRNWEKVPNNTNERVKRNVQTERIDRNTLILLGIISFVVIIILLKLMGTLMTAITVLGIAIIILFAILLRKIRRNKVIRVLTNIFFILFLIGCIAGVCGVAYFGYIIVDEAPEWDISKLSTKESTILYTSDGVEYANLSTEKREKITYDEASENLINAIIATEDSRFFEHNGFDPLRFFKAGLGQVSGNSDAGGASTLSMQVIKNNMTSKVATGVEGIKRKFTDIYLAVFKLEKEFTKEQIFEFYINNHFLGSNTYGVEEASLTYFGKHAKELNLSEAALLAGMYQSPNAYNPKIHTEAAAERRAEVLNLMYRHGYISKEERDMANSIPIEGLVIESSDAAYQPYQSYIDTVIDELINDWGIDPYTTSLEIYTNINTKKQQGLDNIFSGKTFKWENKVVQAGIAAVDVWTGKIVAVAGSRDNDARTLNRATTGKRQVGSTAKPIFDYGPAMEYNNYSTYTIIDDSPYTYSNGKPIRDSDRKYMGKITVRTALAQSRNIPALKAFQAVSNDNRYKFVTSLGIKPETTEGSTYMHEAHAIGAFNGSNPLQMAAAYAAFANGGTYYKPYTINKIVYRDTGEEVEYESEGVPVMSSATAYMMTYCLEYTVTDGLAKGVKINGVHLAAKTGTTNYTSDIAKKYNLPSYAVPDAWIIGYDPDTAVGMWYGYDKIYNGKTGYYLKSATSGYKVNVATERNRLYKTAGKVLFTSKKKFKVPDTVVKVAIEKGSPNPGRLASSSTPAGKITYEYYKKGTEPTEVSTTYSKLSNVTNLSATYDYTTKYVRLSWTASSKSKDADKSYGDFGYKIYKNNKFLTFTTDTYYTYTGDNPEGTYKVVTAYKNYSDIDSSGVTRTISASQTDTSTYSATTDVTSGSTYSMSNHCFTSNPTSCIHLIKDGATVSSGYSVSVSYYESDGSKYSTLSEDNIDEAGTRFSTIVYDVKYNGASRAKVTVSNVTITR